jgi:hypothetical protein
MNDGDYYAALERIRQLEQERAEPAKQPTTCYAVIESFDYDGEELLLVSGNRNTAEKFLQEQQAEQNAQIKAAQSELEEWNRKRHDFVQSVCHKENASTLAYLWLRENHQPYVPAPTSYRIDIVKFVP